MDSDIVWTVGTGRRTAIVCSLGPSSDQPSTVAAMARAGMDIVRLSMGNGDSKQHAATARLVRKVAAETGRPLLLMADLQARKNRLGELPGGRAEWTAGAEVVLSAVPVTPSSNLTWVRYPWNTDRIPPDSRVQIDDGAIVLGVVDVSPLRMRCVVVEGGTATSGRGVAVPGCTNVSPGLVERDRKDLAFARSLGVDLVALSFACSAADAAELRGFAPEQTLIAKIEHPGAVAILPELADAFDALMVARGDLGVELPFELVPGVQKDVVALCAQRGRASIVATQLLHTMRENPLPTRAEVSDVANAVFDGADAVMVTGETGYGRHPLRVVEVLHRVISAAEARVARVATIATALVPPSTSVNNGAIDV